MIQLLTRGLILLESPPRLLMASRIEARSTTAGTPVKSWWQKTQIERWRNSYHNNSNYLVMTYLQENPGRLEGNFHKLWWCIFPINDLLNIFFCDLEVVTVTNGRFKEDSDGIRQLICHGHEKAHITAVILNRQNLLLILDDSVVLMTKLSNLTCSN